MTLHSHLGMIFVGDLIQFIEERTTRIGKVLHIDSENYTIHVYVEDSTGGYKLIIRQNQIEKLLKTEELKKPERYNKRGKLECWDVILDQEMNFLEGNIIKYVWRYKEKNGIEDLKKAKVYLDKLISEVEKK